MNWGFLLFRGSYTYKKGLIVQSSSKTTQLLDPLLNIKVESIEIIIVNTINIFLESVI